MMGHRIWAVFPLALILLALPGARAVSPGYPDIRIELSPPERSVNSSYYEQKVVFDGTVTVDNPSNASVQILLWGGSPAMSAICSPDHFSLQDSGDQPFNLTITVTKNIWNRTFEFWVSGEAHLAGQLVATNQSNRVRLAVGDRPLNGDSGRGDLGISYGDDGRASMQWSVFIAAVSAAAVASAFYAARRRRRRRREARQ